MGEGELKEMIDVETRDFKLIKTRRFSYGIVEK